MIKRILSLPDKIEVIAREMCNDLGIDPDMYVGDNNKSWEQFKEMVKKNLEEDALQRAKDKLWAGKI